MRSSPWQSLVSLGQVIPWRMLNVTIRRSALGAAVVGARSGAAAPPAPAAVEPPMATSALVARTTSSLRTIPPVAGPYYDLTPMSGTSGAAVPATMRAAVYRGPRDVVVEERPVPELGSHDVLLEVSHCG